jgi:hypothetical protein
MVQLNPSALAACATDWMTCIHFSQLRASVRQEGKHAGWLAGRQERWVVEQAATLKTKLKKICAKCRQRERERERRDAASRLEMEKGKEALFLFSSPPVM